jgi:ABC-type polysaccharide/polyol phosphate export permease
MIATYKAAWDKRALITFLVKHVRRASVSATVLGQIWYLILPASELLVYYLLIVVIFQRGAQYGENPFVSLSLGIMHYHFLQIAASAAMTSIYSKSKILLQIKLEPIVLVFAGFRRAVFDAFPAIALALVIWAVAGGGTQNPTRPWFYPLVLLVWLVFAWIMSLFLATATVFARDLTYFVPIVLRLLMYLSPVVYTLDFYPVQFRPLALINPVASIFGYLRWSLLGERPPPWQVIPALAATLIVGLVIAHGLYAWARPRFTKNL